MSPRSCYRYWPRDEDGQESPGPNPKQRLLWIEKMPAHMRPHQCVVDGVLCLGGTRSGKTVGVTARLASIMTKNPGARIIVGSTDYAKLRTSVVLDWQELFSQNSAWDHPSVKEYPTRQCKHLLISNGRGKRDSIVHFVNLEKRDGENVLGQACDAFQIDEPQSLERGSEVQNTLITRLSNNATKTKQFFLTGNPSNHLKWLTRDWELKQYMEGYTGPPIPIGKPCEHQFCARCKLRKNGRMYNLYVDGVCPICSYIKKVNCPGAQYSRRVILSSAEDNMEFLPESYQDIMDTQLSGKAAKKFGQGVIVRDTGGICYPKFGEWNKPDKDRKLDLKKDMYWFLDLNQRPQASGILQDRKVSGIKFFDVIDEFALWDKDVIDVGEAFVERYSKIGFEGIVWVDGDPAMKHGQWVRYKDMKTKDKFKILERILKDAGFRVKLVPSRKRTTSIKDRIECTNYNFKNEDNVARVSVNSNCKWLIESLETTKWAPGEKEESKVEDRRVMTAGQEGEVYGCTHHAAALGYAMLNLSPMVKIITKQPFFVGSTGNVVILNENGDIEQRDYSTPEPEEEQEDEDELYKDPEPSIFAARRQPQGLLASLHSQGLTNLRRVY